MRQLLEKLARAEKNFVETQFLAPRLRGNKVRVKFEGLVKAYTTTPADFEGWGVFRAKTDHTAVLVHKASPVQVADYLKLFKTVRLILVRPVRDRTWLAYPVNSGSYSAKFGTVGAVLVHLVTLGRAFEHAVCRWDGNAFWFDRIDRRCDPTIPVAMARALKSFVAPEAVKFPGLTPELRTAYSLIFKNDANFRVRCSEDRLKQALAMGGGQLESFADLGDYWTTQWVTSTGERHTSAISKSDLTVLSAGICLDGEDQKFDLQSLVGVVERQEY